MAASQASISARARLRCSGHCGTFSAQCVQYHQATNHPTHAQYLWVVVCFFTVYTLNTSIRTDCLVDIIMNTT